MSPIDRLLCDLDAHPWSTIDEVAGRLGWSRRIAAERLSTLRAVEVLVSRRAPPAGRASRPYVLYALAGGDT